MTKKKKAFSRLCANNKVLNLQPVDSVAARTTGAYQQQKRLVTQNQIKSRIKELRKSPSPHRREWLLKEISKLERKLDYVGPSDKSLVNRSAIRRAEIALQKAKWERENRRMYR